jgi:SpoVK/Ycf46/Vps4 family AAA+-type ATPase
MAPDLHLPPRTEDRKMLNAEDQIKKLAALTGVMLMATAEALAQENASRPTRRIVVSISDRKLAVM